MMAVMRFSALGDIANMLPVFRVMNPQPCVITSPLGQAFLKDEFSDFLVLPDKTVVSHFRLIRDIRRRRFSDILDFQGNDRSRFFTACSGSTVHNGYNPNARGRPYSPLVSQLQEEAQKSLVFSRKPRNYIILNTGSSAKWPSKRLPVAKWIEFARVLNERFGLPLKLTGSEDEVDYVTSVARELPGDIEVLAGKTSLVGLKQVIREAFLTVSTDSAAIHISAVERTPIVGIFGATTWKRFNYVPWAVALYDRTFYPDGIPPERTLTAVRNYYDHIDLAEGLDALKAYLE